MPTQAYETAAMIRTVALPCLPPATAPVPTHTMLIERCSITLMSDWYREPDDEELDKEEIERPFGR
ncbi:uncharacterized protein FIESC28_07157 [Fusarium coffeatum]|uniref:Uncharacterized protein n=1 Tax=Fusarium coffeatum TaxID=231269 RepID=A0A366RGM9_9HYPO|nr:uncharacterized protein FIESC28_07157 [Fusarium coffeatum]RBR15912.1 hypothetical protein FIESC28_07157 [Fusarium coffeatum]